MVILRLGLIVGSLAFLYVGWASWSAGYPPEVASVRGVVAFMAVTIVAYFGELVVATAPEQHQPAASSTDRSTPATAGAAAPAAPAGAASATAGDAAGITTPSAPALAGAEQLASLTAGEPIVAPDFGAAAQSMAEAEPVELRPAA